MKSSAYIFGFMSCASSLKKKGLNHFPLCGISCERHSSNVVFYFSKLFLSSWKWWTLSSKAHPFFDCLFIALSNHRNFILYYRSPHCRVLVCCWLVTFFPTKPTSYTKWPPVCISPAQFCFTAPAVWSLLCFVTHLPYPLSVLIFLFCFTAASFLICASCVFVSY